MYRTPDRAQRSPAAPRPAVRFPSPASGWGYPRSPYGRSGQRGASPRGCPAYSPASPGYSPGYSPGSHRGYRDGSPVGFRDSPAGFGNGSRGFGDSPAGFGKGSRGFGNGSRGFGGQMRCRGSGGLRRPQSFSPASANFQVEKYFSPSMLQDPWAALQPVAVRK
ncbi:M-phase-specific PLK1-interacting protein isoform X3 [Etheostoma cragini]|uniref:M-phase-specific PLK1-interacting protein isoform X2 n=1 Tax=Etheostoma cragini TaxID=417921 RepID=UPI00155EF432|nr:M-phase-specific PLK1-interacting protein isoform X2 [Etheostoma cragini]XP_034744751.1 M-phase-specific PLK1-interacting protein isoform X3 [Etheostoma cragini]